MRDFICKICNEHCKSLKNHITSHNISKKDYYDTYMNIQKFKIAKQNKLFSILYI